MVFCLRVGFQAALPVSHTEWSALTDSYNTPIVYILSC